jgi:dihydrolipoamide dehydrogenase
MDLEVARQFQRLLSRQGLGFKLGAKVTEVDEAGDRLLVTTQAVDGGDSEKMKADVLLVAVGRRPYTEGLGLEEVGLTIDNHGRIEVDRHYATSVEGIHAIGDVIRGPMLAHKAEDEGVCVAEHLAGQKSHLDYNAIPAVIYTAPEVASVGKTEEELKEARVEYKTGKFPFSANSRARATGRTDGFVKVIADARTDRLLGVHIIGAEAGTMIAEAALAIEFGASSEDLARSCHAHPTLEEAIKEAALATHGAPIHI